MYLGVDGCPDGWITVSYSEQKYNDTRFRPDINQLWTDYGDSADIVLIDIPIGLREDSNEPRQCDTAARRKLSPKRHSSVFPPPVRQAVSENSYADAKAKQEKLTEGSLGVQSWAISDKINQLDRFLRIEHPGAQEKIREAHPEVCFWALNDNSSMNYSKSGQPAAAFWERVEVLRQIDPGIHDHLRDASMNLDEMVGNDDVIDAFALALTASPLTSELHSLPDKGPEFDEKELPMEIVYSTRGD